MKVKICGITSYDDAALALDQGVDALGFNFFPGSPRYVAPAAVRSIVRRLPPLATTVGLFVNVADFRDVAKVATEAGVQVLQLHGDESVEYCRCLDSWPLIKALRMSEGMFHEDLRAYPVQAFLLDARDDFRFGGTGTTFDWSLSSPVKEIRPVILAGGLHAENVGEAIRSVRPYGVDVCSGVERSPGKKDASRVIAFMKEVRNASKTF